MTIQDIIGVIYQDISQYTIPIIIICSAYVVGGIVSSISYYKEDRVSSMYWMTFPKYLCDVVTWFIIGAMSLRYKQYWCNRTVYVKYITINVDIS